MPPKQSLTFGPYVLDLDNTQLWRDGEPVRLTPKAWQVLSHLVAHPNQLVTRDDLFRAVWRDTVVGEATLTTCLQEIRQALGDSSRQPRYIETVHRRGYRFIAPLATNSHPSPESRVQGLESKKHEEAGRPRTPDTRPQTLDVPLVGRESELTHLHHWLDKAMNGERQIVFVTGEPGIGKTALIEAFVQRLASSVQSPEENQKSKGKWQKSKVTDPQPLAPDPWLAHGQCIEHYGSGEAYLPILSALGQLGHGPERERLQEVLQQYAPTWLMQLPSLLTPAEIAALQPQTAGATKERMLREIAEALEILTTETPLILVLEDLHWSDYSTLDLLAFLARRQQHARLLILGTYRPVEMLSNGHPLRPIVQELQGHRLCEELPLPLLTEAAVGEYLAVRGIPDLGARRTVLLQTLARTIHQRTEGNPLFMVNLVADLLGRGALQKHERIAGEIAIPDTIRHLIARQIDRLPADEQHLLEAASIAGMEFSVAAVAAAMTTETQVVEQHCEQLAERQQFFKRLGVEEWPDGTLAARYRFLRALYQQLWHERVSPTQLQHYHLQIGERKEQAYGERAREIAAELTVLFEQGREYQRAVHYHGIVGQQALQRSAPQEAISYATKGIELLETLSDTPTRQQQELSLQMILGTAMQATKSFAAPEVERAYVRARELCHLSGNPPHLLPILFGLLLFYIARGKIKLSRELETQLHSLVQRYQDPILFVEFHLASGLLLSVQGELASAHTALAHCLALYKPEQAPTHTALYGQDPGVAAGMLSAFVHWLRGYSDRAVRQAQDTLALMHRLSHPHSQALALFWAASFLKVYEKWTRCKRTQMT